MIVDEIKAYYAARDLVWPTALEALAWAVSEMGEFSEQLVARREDWIRNNDHADDEYTDLALAEEAADVMMMLYVALLQSGNKWDLHKVLRNKMRRKMGGTR